MDSANRNKNLLKQFDALLPKAVCEVPPGYFSAMEFAKDRGISNATARVFLNNEFEAKRVSRITVKQGRHSAWFYRVK